MSNQARAELHRHLELSWRKSTLKEVAPSVGIEIHSDQDLAREFELHEPKANLGEALQMFLNYQSLLGSEELLERLSFEAALDAYQKEGLEVVEFRYAPTFIADRHKHLTYDKIHQALVRGLEKAEKEVPLATGLICIIQRILSVEAAEKSMAFAVENKDTFVGVDLADNEEGFDSKPFSQLFQKARQEGLGVTIHSGEANLPNAPRYVKEAIEVLGAQRIGHGLQIHKDPEIMKYVADKKIPLEICPTSNYLTNAVPSLEEHPLKKLIEAGVITTLNTDDPAPFVTDMNKEIDIARNQLDLTGEDIEQCMLNAARSSFIEREKIKRVWTGPAL